MEGNLMQRLLGGEGGWRGTGRTPAGQAFAATLSVARVAGGRGITLRYDATSPEGVTLHEELLLLGPHPMGRLALWGLGSAVDAVMEHRLRRTDASTTWVFGFGVRDDLEGFRQEITIAFQQDGSLALHHGWGLPGQPMTPGPTASFRHA